MHGGRGKVSAGKTHYAAQERVCQPMPRILTSLTRSKPRCGNGVAHYCSTNPAFFVSVVNWGAVAFVALIGVCLAPSSPSKWDGSANQSVNAPCRRGNQVQGDGDRRRRRH